MKSPMLIELAPRNYRISFRVSIASCFELARRSQRALSTAANLSVLCNIFQMISTNHPPTKLREGNVLNRVYLSFCSQKGALTEL